jgi:hypothetical protein
MTGAKFRKRGLPKRGTLDFPLENCPSAWRPPGDDGAERLFSSTFINLRATPVLGRPRPKKH